jgi:polysaccharide export outer membrane protein
MTRKLARRLQGPAVLVIGLFIALAGWLLPATARAQTQPAAGARLEYVIGAGDVLRINVYQSADLTLEVRVSENGTVSYPLLGTLTLGGLSVAQAEATVADGLRRGNFLRNPQVSVLLVQVRGNQAAVLGMVNRPGRYPIEVAGLRLSELLAAAGGIAPGGGDIVVHTGVRDGRVVRTSVDIGRLLTSGGSEQDPVIRHGDTLYVERMPMVYIYGEVQRPGSFRLERGMTVMQALASGGGVTPRGTVKGLKVHRRTPEGRVQEVEPSLADTLREGDVIFVRESLF